MLAINFLQSFKFFANCVFELGTLLSWTKETLEEAETTSDWLLSSNDFSN